MPQVVVVNCNSTKRPCKLAEGEKLSEPFLCSGKAKLFEEDEIKRRGTAGPGGSSDRQPWVLILLI